MKSWPLLLIVTAASLALSAADTTIGMVNMKSCIEKSKLGIQEKNGFDSLRKQVTEKLEKMDKELASMAKKLEDQDYMDSLSPSAEKELKTHFQELNQEMVRAQNQYYQLLNQANYKLLQTVHDSITAASETVRAKRNLTAVLNSETAFAAVSSLNVTDDVVLEMDKIFDKEKASNPSPANPAVTNPTAAK